MTLLLLTLGCANNGIDGIWLMRVAYESDDGCATDLDHNFEDSYTAAEGPWTETWLDDRTESLVLAQVSQLDGDTAILVIGTQVWPGSHNGGGSWNFTWTATDSEQYSIEHDEGYVYTEQVERADTDKLKVKLDGDAASGTWSADWDETVRYEESDEWDSSVGIAMGQIPSAEHLFYEQPGAGDQPRNNTIGDAECSSSRCELVTASVCSGSYAVDLERTGYDDEGAYDQLEDVGRPYGTGS